jgi:hypothetical protein
MYKRRTLTVDPNYFPLNRMREVVDYLQAMDNDISSAFFVLWRIQLTEFDL